VANVTPAAVIDAINASASTEVLPLLRILHSLPFDKVSVCTTVMEPGLSTYSGSFKLMIQSPPGWLLV
jgi:hypothetical protein